MADASALRAQYIDHNARVADEAARLMFNELLVVVPVGATGDTRRGLGFTPSGDQLRPSFLFTSASIHGDYVEEGTDAVTIVPRTARVLRFQGGSGRISQPSPNSRIATRSGGVVFAMHVDKPAVPARPWFRPVVERWDEFLERAEALTG